LNKNEKDKLFMNIDYTLKGDPYLLPFINTVSKMIKKSETSANRCQEKETKQFICV